MKDAIEAFAAHVAGAPGDAIPAEAAAAARTFILDTLGVGIAGSAGPGADGLPRVLATLGAGPDARVWGTGERLPAASAALCNAYRAHCQEFDCVHEAAVAHVVTVVLPAAAAIAERAGGISGRRLVEAVVLGVDVAAGLGVAATSGLRFFRPATAGAFGGVAAIGRLMDLPEPTLLDAFGLALGQLSGTMQAHTEGSGMLAMQMGFSARNAVTACDLARAGFGGPRGVLEGKFGYFQLFEAGGDLAPVVASLGRDWRIAEVAHKPFPSGRATHGIIDGCLRLQREHGLAAGRIAAVHLAVPPLVEHLVGRPPLPAMDVNYARLSARYVAAAALIGQGLGTGDFAADALRRPEPLALAERITLEVREASPNALTPIKVTIETTDGATHACTVTEVYGSPANPMPKAAQIEKFRRNCAAAVRPLPADRADAIVATVDRLDDLPAIGPLIDLTVA